MDLSQLLLEANTSLTAGDDAKAKEILLNVAASEVKIEDEDAVRYKTQAMLDLGQLYKRTKAADEIVTLIKTYRPFLSTISKARASKVVRTLMDCFLDIHSGSTSEIDVCKDNINWATEEHRSYLRQALQVRLVALYHEKQLYDDALDLSSKLLKELKKIDDKHLIVDVQLLESRIFYSLGNLARSRASLTSARTTANSIYCPPKLQSSLDIQSGIMHAADSDFKTAYSYFYEAFDGFDSIDDPRAVTALKYMLLCKIMLHQGSTEDMRSVLTGKITLKYSGPEIDSMKAIDEASRARSLAQFEQVVSQYKGQLSEDEVVRMQLDTLYDTLFDNNLSKLIEPFSRVEIGYIAKMINRSKLEVEKKLSMMILDKRLNGILDQNAGILVLFDDKKSSHLYPEAITLIGEMDKVIDVLFSRAKVI